ncbi:MAG: hypothetical protein IJ242_08890 [Clostridia bacterium]|nr:hypothetical protein [Clostridia bacterium]
MAKDEKRPMDPLSMQIDAKKKNWYSRVKLSIGQLNVIIYITIAALIVVFVLIALEAAGIFVSVK